jgi:DNA replication and repair protein RecF
LRVDELALEDFRNYERAHLELAAGLNLVVGRNAQGKTNLLEALHCLAGFGSPRAPDAALVKDGAERALLHALVTRARRTLRVDMEIRPGRGTRALVNKTPIESGRTLMEMTTTVFFGPDELSLIKGSPDGRRRFVDDLVVKLRPTRYGLRREWERVLRQRNALLRSLPRDPVANSARATLEVWDESLCRVGAAVARARLEALGRLWPHAVSRYRETAGGGVLELAYVSSWLKAHDATRAVAHPDAVDQGALRRALEEAMAEARAREVERGMSLVGPQRDDIAVRLSSGGAPPLDARAFASQGEQRTAALALKLGEFDLLAEALGERPIVLLDDVFSELDPMRRSWLADAVRGLGQVLVSSAEPGVADVAAAESIFEVEAGKVVARG